MSFENKTSIIDELFPVLRHPNFPLVDLKINTSCVFKNTQTVIIKFLYSTVSTLNPIVGIEFTTSPSLSLYSIVVFPALSNPSIKMRGGEQHEKHLRINLLQNEPICLFGCLK